MVKRFETREEFMDSAEIRWKANWSIVTDFLDWVRANGYWEIGTIDKSGRKEVARSWKNAIKEEGWYEKAKRGDPVLSLLYSVGHCKHRVPKKMKNFLYDITSKLLSDQYDGKRTEARNLVDAVGLTAMSAYSALLGLTVEELADSPMGPHAKAFNQTIKDKKMKHSYELAKPLVDLVSQVLNEGVQEYLQLLEGR